MLSRQRLISIVTPCFNEEENVEALATTIQDIFRNLKHYDYEHIFIDNDSKDRTPALLRALAHQDKRIKVIFNSRNFGHIRSPFYGLLQARGDAAILMASDFQDPPILIPELLRRWESGYHVVKCIKSQSLETKLMFRLRTFYYQLISSLSDLELTKNFTGFGLYDHVILKALRSIKDPYPYFRGLISEIGFRQTSIEFLQPKRSRGITKNNFYTLFDLAMLGITNHSKVPLRIATLTGFLAAFVSFLIGFTYFFLKIILWNSFQMGLAPLIVGMSFFAGIQLIFIGILGEYIGFIHTAILQRPLVIEKERLNFESAQDEQDFKIAS